MTTRYDMFTRKQIQADRCICLVAKSTGKPYEGKPHVRFDEKMLEIGYGCDGVTLRGNGEKRGRQTSTCSHYASVLLYNRQYTKRNIKLRKTTIVIEL